MAKAFLVERDVNRYGSVSGGEDDLPTSPSAHDWCTPYPIVAATMALVRARPRAPRPNVFWHPYIPDWLCDQASYDILRQFSDSDLRCFGRGILDGEPIYVVQVVAMISGVVERELSIVDEYDTYEIMRFPAFTAGSESRVARRVFRVPEMYPAIFAGDTVKQALEAAGITGLRFVAVD